MSIELPPFISGELIGFFIRLGVAILIVIIGRWLASATRRWLASAFSRTSLTPSMITLFLTLAYYSVWILAMMIALIVMGVPATTVVAAVGIVIIILGIALQQSLRDLAASINFVLFKPFAVGDLIETRGITGVVEEIQLFSTVLVRWDNKVVILPNGEIQQNGIINFSKKGFLRTDLIFGISYGDNVATARRLIEQVLTADARVLPEPQPEILVSELGDSSVNLSVRAAVTPTDYWSLQNDLREQIKMRFDEEGITIPFPQSDVRIIKEA